MQYQCDEPIVIELDDPAPRGARLLGAATAVLILALIVAPYILNTPGDDRSGAVTAHQGHTTVEAEYCQPAVELPGALASISQLAMPSFLRLCDWFGPQPAPAAAPLTQPVNAPADRPGPRR